MAVGGDAIAVPGNGVDTAGGIGDGVSTAAVGGVSVGTALGIGRLSTVGVDIFCLSFRDCAFPDLLEIL